MRSVERKEEFHWNMATWSEEDLCCPVCHDVFTDPVLLSCSHSLCTICLQSWWKQTQTRQCPVCRVKSDFEPTGNLVLKNLCEAFRQKSATVASPTVCSLHSDPLRLFCLDHQQLVCLVCRDSDKHRGHTFRPLDEAAQQHREELLLSLKKLKDNLRGFRLLKDTWVQTAAHVKFQALRTEKSIQQHFKKLRLLLEKEEESRIRALRKEEKMKNLLVKEQEETLNHYLETLARTIQSTEEALKASDVSFLLGFKAAVEQVEDCPMMDPPQLPPGALIDEAKHLGNLGFKVWSNMKMCASPVILDPNTAAFELLLSPSLSSLHCGDPLKLPDNPERLKYCSVLGSEGFSTGSCCWDVEVGDNSLWELGVVEDSASMKKDIYSRVWRMGLYHDEYKTSSPYSDFTELAVKVCPRIIRVKLDLDRGQLTFSDPNSNTHIHSFAHTFKNKVFPFFSTVDEAPLSILPVKVSVTVEQSL